ncbi:hypothetical protein ACP275_01G004700 [Erythranthe tilingii]
MKFLFFLKLRLHVVSKQGLNCTCIIHYVCQVYICVCVCVCLCVIMCVRMCLFIL